MWDRVAAAILLMGLMPGYSLEWGGITAEVVSVMPGFVL